MPERGERRPEHPVHDAFATAARFYRLRKEALPPGDDELHAWVVQQEYGVLRVLRDAAVHDPAAAADAMADLAAMAQRHADARTVFLATGERLYGDVAVRDAHAVLAKVVELVRVADEELGHRLQVQLHTLRRREEVPEALPAAWERLIATRADHAAHAAWSDVRHGLLRPEEKHEADRATLCAVEAVYLLEQLRTLHERATPFEAHELLETLQRRAQFLVDFFHAHLHVPLPIEHLQLGKNTSRWAALANGLDTIRNSYVADPNANVHTLVYKARIQQLLKAVREQ